jgi:hypothetical protein
MPPSVQGRAGSANGEAWAILGGRLGDGEPAGTRPDPSDSSDAAADATEDAPGAKWPVRGPQLRFSVNSLLAVCGPFGYWMPDATGGGEALQPRLHNYRRLRTQGRPRVGHAGARQSRGLGRSLGGVKSVRGRLLEPSCSSSGMGATLPLHPLVGKSRPECPISIFRLETGFFAPRAGSEVGRWCARGCAA